MSDDVIKVTGTIGSYKDKVGGTVDAQFAVRGVVKNNIDATRSGRLQVYIADFGLPDPDDSAGWVTVSYMSPFYGITPGNPVTGTGTFTDNPHSYGFWAVPPDLNTEVICLFLNGKQDFGYFIGCIPQPGLTQMVPAMGGTTHHLESDSEKSKFLGTDDLPLPVVELNNKDKSVFEDPGFHTNNRPVHSSVASQLWQQGLLRDPVRGSITSSSMRESPSRVFGFSSPGRPIYKGKITGDTEADIAKQVPDATDDALKVVARRGGHTFVMDDGDVDGFNQLIRLRTSAGHQITMSDDGQTLFITHANGQSYVELGKEGTVDIYTINSFNVRSQGDINFHADRNINIHAKKDLNIFAENIHTDSEKETTVRTGTEFKQHTLGDHTVKVAKSMSFASDKPASFLSGSTTYVNGSIINLNTGKSSLQPSVVKPIPQQAHTDTLFDNTNGWLPSPGTLPSIAGRVPAHSPWANTNKGVDVKVDTGADSAVPSAPSSAVQSTNNSVAGAPKEKTTPALVSTAPPVQATSASMDKATTSAVVSQTAVDAATGPTASAVANGAGVVDLNGTKQAILGKLGQTPQQLEDAGHLKPGTAELSNALISQGKTIEQAMPPSVWTGQGGVVNVNSFVNSQTSQTNAQVSLMQNSFTQLQGQGIITGNESAGQVAGIVNSASKFGVSNTVDFIKNSSNNLPPGTAISGIAAIVPGIGSSVSGSISSGNFAANLADKTSGASGSILASIKSGVGSAVDSVKGAVGSTFGAIKNALSGNGPNPTMNAFPNGVGDINNLVNKAGGMVSSNPSAGALTAAIAAISSNGGTVKMPTIAENTFNRAGIDSATKGMLPPGVQTSPTAMKPVEFKPYDPALQAEYDGLKKELNTQDDLKWDLQKKMYDARKNYGPDSSEYQSAAASYKECLEKLRSIREKMSETGLKFLKA